MTVAARSYTADGATSHDDPAAARDAPGTAWVRVTESDPEAFRETASVFDIHHLSVEDVVNDVRPKSEEFDEYTFVLVRTAELRGDSTRFADELRDQPVGMFVGPDWLVTLSQERLPAVEQVWTALGRGRGRLLRRGPDFVAYRLLDGVVDGYFDLLDEIELRIEDIEDDLLGTPETETLESINEVRRDLLAVRKLLWPTQRAVGVLAGGGPEHIEEATEKYYRDVYDHLVQLVNLVDTYRELVVGSREMYLNALSASTNEVMKTLTVVASIVLPLSLVAGIYGMNFSGGAFDMPELQWAYAYPAVLVGMAAVALVLVVYFRREGWL